MLRSYEDEYRWNVVGATAGFEVLVTERRGVIVELRTRNWFTSSSKVGDGVHAWRLKRRTVKASKPASGNFELIIARR